MNALIVVDVQNDFLPGGSLGVNDGDKIVEKINAITNFFDYCVYTKDWHPANHTSFDTVWPHHCVQYSKGAEFSKYLIVPKNATIIYKGDDIEIDSYSAFFNNDRTSSTPLAKILASKNVDTVYLCGIATDFCVKFSALDAISLGFNTYVIEDLTKPVFAENFQDTLKFMQEAGAKIISSDIILNNNKK